MSTRHLVQPDGTINTGKAKHTPAPWNVTNLDTSETVFYIGGQSGSIASAWNKGGGEGEANAKLIAAAPETAAERDQLKEDLKNACSVIVDQAKQIGTLKAALKQFDYDAPALWSYSPKKDTDYLDIRVKASTLRTMKEIIN